MRKKENKLQILQQYAPPGSDLYYVLRKVAPDDRQAYLALSGLCHELNRTGEHYKEVSVAEKKLLWFAEEIENFFNHKASHPLLQALLPYRERFNKTAMLALVEANLLSIKTHIFETRAELLQHYQHLGGISFSLKASLLNQPQPEKTVYELGLIDEVLRHLLHFRTFLNRQHLYFALEDFQNHKIDPQPILHFKQLETLQPLFMEYCDFANQNFSHMNKSDLKPLKLEVLLKLKQAQLTGRLGWQFFQHQVELSPLRKLLITAFY